MHHNDDIALIKTLTPNQNLFGGATKPVCAANSQKSFTDCSWEVSAESREASEQRVAALIAQTQKSL